jgi:esterase/lipase superfamily enzyme
VNRARLRSHIRRALSARAIPLLYAWLILQCAITIRDAERGTGLFDYLSRHWIAYVIPLVLILSLYATAAVLRRRALNQKAKRIPFHAFRPTTVRRRYHITKLSQSVVQEGEDEVESYYPGVSFMPSHIPQLTVERLNAASGQTVYPVWFGTNRKPIKLSEFIVDFSNQHHDLVSVGRVDVVVPDTHRFGEIGSSFWRRLWRRDLRNDRLEIASLESMSDWQLWHDLRQEMRLIRENGDSPQGLIYLHGYRNSFDDAAIRAAQIGFDLKIPGAMAFFSWPSRGKLFGYTADETGIESSESAITNFIIDFARNSSAEKIHVIAHSMGNRGLLRSLQRIIADAESRAAVRFGQIFLAAPDVDRRLFLQLAHVYPAVSERTTLYSSNRDLAVYFSVRFHSGARAGYFLPHTTTTGIDTVAVPGFNVDLLGHGYFAQAEALLHDMHDLIRHNEPPRLRQRVEPLFHENEQLWQIRR